MGEASTATQRPFKDYYQILHLHAEADAAMVDQAYWHLARVYNGAIPNDSQAAEKLEELNEAYSVLRSPESRMAYDKVRNQLLSQGMLPTEPEPEREAPPLAVMAKQRPKPRKKAKQEEGTERRGMSLTLRYLNLPPWQSAVGAVIIFVMASAALFAGAQPLLIVGLLVLGLAVTLVPIIRNLPRMPSIPSPTISMPSVRAPRMPERHNAPSVDADALHQATEAMRSRWRSESGETPTAFPQIHPWPKAGPEPPEDDSADEQA